MLRFTTLISTLAALVHGIALPVQVQHNGREVSPAVFKSLEELARIVDISYCVGTTGISKPFNCYNRCDDFKGFELVSTWNTGPLLSDSCGYIAVSHEPYQKRVIVAFRGTYSIASTIVDLSTNPAKYAPFPEDGDGSSLCSDSHNPGPKEPLLPQLFKQNAKRSESEKCTNCTVHSGFMASWRNTRCVIIPDVEKALKEHPGYELVLVGHSLGGAVAALAALEFQARGWSPHVTTFGEPRIGNKELSEFIDRRFNLHATNPDEALYRRVTHVSDPVPLLPFEEWGYKMHAGEIYISKSSVPPSRSDLQHCVGDQDPQCIEDGHAVARNAHLEVEADAEAHTTDPWIPKRYQLWQLFFAHRDYFWRLGLCTPWGDPWDWGRAKYNLDDTTDEL